MTVPDFLIWRCVGCDKPAEGNVKPCDCVTQVGGRDGPNGRREYIVFADPPPTAEVLMQRAMEAWRAARDACPHRDPVDHDGPCCTHDENQSTNGWCSPEYCPLFAD